mmetsp:Transcript_57967/g.130332  ORF Transcript_57967/g.130332 Transcript_57967/m.130332 type:complete len:266 (-) Transcript_57967:272-1069(-)
MSLPGGSRARSPDQGPLGGVHQAAGCLQCLEDLARRLASRHDLWPSRQVSQHGLEPGLARLCEDVRVDGDLRLLLGRNRLSGSLRCTGRGRLLCGLGLVAGRSLRGPAPLGSLWRRRCLLAASLLLLLLGLLLGGGLDLGELGRGLPLLLLLEELGLLLLVLLLERLLVLGAGSLPHLGKLRGDMLHPGLRACRLERSSRLLALRRVLREGEVRRHGLLRNQMRILVPQDASRVTGLQVNLELLGIALLVLRCLVLELLLALLGE